MAPPEPRGQELIERYRKNYSLSADFDITEEKILKHWELEKRLTRELLDSTPDNRWKTFDHCYTTLYSELPWLNEPFLDNTSNKQSMFEVWQYVIRKPPQRIYEIGSGKGELIYELARNGYHCTGTEITRERGSKHVQEHENLSWSISDGVHLDQFEESTSYDVVISDQVVEHIHPHDLLDHFRGVSAILAERGRYIFMTPHKLVGPSDVSLVFKCDRPMGMHLREYSNGELTHLLMCAGFSKVQAFWSVPQKIGRLIGITPRPTPSSSYLIYLRILEKLISLVPGQSFRRKFAALGRLVFFRGLVFLVATK